MSYQITRTDGTPLVEVLDQTIDNSTTSLSLVGKGAFNYGKPVAENFIGLLENFSSAAAPPNPMVGQFWYDNGTKRMRFYDGTSWNALNFGAYTVSDNAVTTSKLADTAVTTSKLANSSVTLGKLANGAVSTVLAFDQNGVPSYLPVRSFGGAGTIADFSLTLRKIAKGSPNAALTFDTNGVLSGTNALTQQSIHISDVAGASRAISFETAGLKRWTLAANTTGETGANAGSSLVLKSYDDSGNDLTTILSIDRPTGTISLGAPLILNANPSVNLGAATKQYVDSKVADAITQLSGGGDLFSNSLSASQPTITYDISTYDYIEFGAVGFTTDGTSSTITNGNRYPGVGINFGATGNGGLDYAAFVPVGDAHGILTDSPAMSADATTLGLTSGSFFASFVAKRLPGSDVWVVSNQSLLSSSAAATNGTAIQPNGSRLMKGNSLSILPIWMDYTSSGGANTVAISAAGGGNLTAGTIKVHARKTA